MKTMLLLMMMDEQEKEEIATIRFTMTKTTFAFTTTPTTIFLTIHNNIANNNLTIASAQI